MEFLNAVLLAGMAAVSVPIVIHLFHKSRFRVVSWGAMHLLEAVLRKNTRRLRLEQLILLLLRCAIPVFLAICMARPVITGLEPLLGDAKSSTVLVLDNSYSMEAGGPNRSNFQQAREAARQIVDHQVKGSDVAVVEMAGGASAVVGEPLYDLDRVRGELARSRSGFGAAEPARALDAARSTAARMTEAHREIVVLSDFQKVSWGEEGGLPGAKRAHLADLLARGPVKPVVTFFKVGREVTDNVSLEKLDFSRMILGVGQQLRVRATLQNHGENAYPDLRVLLRVDGKERDVRQTSLDAHAQAQVLFTHTFDTSGSHVVEVFADADTLAADNGWMASIPVWDRVPVLLVSGDSNPEPLRGETDFIEVALRPYGAAKVELADLIKTTTIEARDLDAKRLAEARVVLLANVPQLNESQLKALDGFVREGGGLLIFPGNRINSQWYNTTLSADGRGLLPLPVVSLAGSMNQAGTQASIVSQHFEHSALEMFNDPRNGNLADAQVWLWYKMRADASRNADPTLTVLARLDTGDPFLVEKQYGEGRVIQCAVPCDADWTNLPMRPFYLPLMQQLTTYLASKVYPPRNVDVGRPLVAFLPVADAGKKTLLTDPDGKAIELVVSNRGTRGVVEFAQTQRPGLYVLDAPGGTKVHFVVNTDRKESDLRQLDEKELQAVAKAMGANVVASWAEYRQLDQQRRFGQEVWQILLIAVLAIIFVEMLLEQFFARRVR
ncbi:MAG TPA: BatA domain-containing protein [Planctomycetota bacterium]|nr:BatA domain-containing protein [Planctomycetota bacterium]